MMKVCCVTLTETPNYGAVLQAYALKKFVASLGCEYTLLNYENRAQKLKFSFFGKTEYMDWKYWLYKKIQYPINRHRIRKIVTFQRKCGSLSERVTKSGLSKIKDQFDVFICGSDQVWNNQEVNHYDDAFFLKFAEEKNTIAYAASFGKTVDMLEDKDKTFYQANIGSIRHISVREESGIEIVKKYSGKDAVLVCDPVFLLKDKEWDKIAISPNRGKYILVYLIGNAVNQECNKRIMQEAQNVSKQLDLPLVKISRGLSSMISEKSFEFPTTPEWLGLIRDAELIITNSFHGTAFSVIYRKNFLCFVDGAENNKMNTRIYSILKRIALEDRLISVSAPGDYLDRVQTEYSSCEDKIDEFINESKAFLINSIFEDKK